MDSGSNNNADAAPSPNADVLEESSVTMLDVLEQEKEMEEEYAAVLGASDEKCCTYTQGAVKRQALYSCLTCCPEARNDMERCAGICLACSYRCHEHHELLELYTKRNFRCDCPTERFGSKHRCALNANLVEPQLRNTDNLYNQNFQGLYCTCQRPYPDPERTTEEVMLQCVICEDWFHLQHLDLPPAAGKLVDMCSEMICGTCMQRHNFLCDYTGLALKALEDADESQANITVTGDVSLCEDNDDNKLRSDLDKSISEIMNIGEAVVDAVTCGSETTVLGESETSASEGQPKKEEESKKEESTKKGEESHYEKMNAKNEGQAKEEEHQEPSEKVELNGGNDIEVNNGEPEPKRRKLESVEEAQSEVKKEKKEEATGCRRPTKKSDYEKGATFWGNDWRLALCQCENCMELYKSQNVEYLLDQEDSAKTYEERGMKRAASESSTYEQGIRALASIGRTQQIDAITEYNRMKDKLKEYLQTFAISKKVVTQEDITRFFDNMRNEKNANVGQPYFCR